MSKTTITSGSLIFFLIFSLFNLSYAKPPHLSQDLMYLNKPIDPVCISDPARDSSASLIDLNKCGMAQSHYVVDGQNDYLAKRGYYGWEWRDVSDPSSPGRGSSYYQTWDAGDHKYWVVDHYNGGGSGYFSTLSLLSRKDSHTIQLVALSGGDRCNGGIDEVTQKGNKLKYSQNITPVDLLSLAGDNSDDSVASDGVYGCASCCTATAVSEADREGDSEFLYVDLSKHPKDNDVEGDGKYQACFDKLISAYVAKGKTKLDDSQLKEFAKKYHAICTDRKILPNEKSNS